MKVLLIFIMLFFMGCNANSENTNSESRFIALESTTFELLGGKEVEANSEIVEDAKALISRSNISEYKLIKTDDVKQNLDNAIIIATIDDSRKIPNAKTFTFAKSISLNEDGSGWNWNADSMGQNLDDFKKILGDDKDKLIIFYDSGEDIFSPAGSAHTALIWAKHLGYNNIARVVGGLNAWVDKGY
ncbi:hypothetical protein CCY99_05900 [Helicobacter sp. 16-1353]|uniref:rhodanese-like domain-containing protein n=1 Tax=Helicobacter sp. 16-1353 TaxID=2004996 RepID=UPI000DCB99BE|nr:rhodanese-like domain-containing protein [Helicobacter sp. 16-1353]RAX53123.1 hypothetical protein CCY99_05900 [Helicobacter sp. 16-1353]